MCCSCPEVTDYQVDYFWCCRTGFHIEGYVWLRLLLAELTCLCNLAEGGPGGDDSNNKRANRACGGHKRSEGAPFIGRPSQQTVHTRMLPAMTPSRRMYRMSCSIPTACSHDLLLPGSFGLPLHPRSGTCAQPTGLLEVTVTDRWIPLVTVAYGTLVARPVRMTLEPRGAAVAALIVGLGPSSVTTASLPGSPPGSPGRSALGPQPLRALPAA